MTVNCQNATSYGCKDQHPLDDFVNRDGINYTNSIKWKKKKKKYADSVTWRLINSRTLQVYKGMEFIFQEEHIKLWYTGKQSRKLFMTSEKTIVSTRNKANSDLLRNQ